MGEYVLLTFGRHHETLGGMVKRLVKVISRLYAALWGLLLLPLLAIILLYDSVPLVLTLFCAALTIVGIPLLASRFRDWRSHGD